MFKSEEEDIWSSILNDVSTGTIDKEKKSLLVLGDEFSGKSSLVSKLRNTKGEAQTIIKQGLGLEYSYINIKDHFTDDIVSRLGIWTVNSNDGQFLEHALNAYNLGSTDKGWNSVVVLVVDYGKPWEITQRLKHWTDTLEKHIESFKITESDKRDLESKLSKSLQEYCLPDGEMNKDVLLPLTDGVLTRNLGIPIVVVCTKVDAMNTLEKDLDYTDAHFDLIQWHLRKFCLELGAGLFYINSKDSTNADNLYKYIVHKLYNFPFDVMPSVIEKDGLMIPAGWDTQQKIDILNDTLRSFNLEDKLEKILTKPVTRSADTSREIKAEDDQDFLTRMQSLLDSDSLRRPKLNRETTAPRLPTTGSTGSSSNNGATDGMLANFFQSLLKQPRGGSGVAPRGASPGTSRQPPTRSVTRTTSEGVGRQPPS